MTDYVNKYNTLFSICQESIKDFLKKIVLLANCPPI